MSVIIPFSEGNLTSIAHKRCEIISSLVGKFKKYSC
jgi:hypothetical protein